MSEFEHALRAAVADSFLAHAEPGVVRQMLHRARAWTFPAGRVFIEPATGHRCGLIVTGLARVYAVKDDGVPTTVRRVGSGAAVGVRAIVGESNTLRVKAITDVEFIELHAPTLIAAAQTDASLAWAVAQEVSRRLMDTEAVLEAAVHGSVSQRVAGALLDLAGDDGLDVAVSHEGLAELVGASRERVGHALRQLGSKGAIGLARRHIAILDAGRLETEAMFRPAASRTVVGPLGRASKIAWQVHRDVTNALPKVR